MLKKDDTYIFDIDNFDIMKVRDSTLLYCNRQCELVLVNKTGMSIVKKLNGNNTIEDIVLLFQMSMVFQKALSKNTYMNLLKE